jgi:hypothetical protein
MPKYWNGASLEKVTIKEGDKEQDVIIAMTEEEANDHSYRDYLKLGATERTQEQLRKKKPLPESKYSMEERSGVLKEYNEFNNRQKNVNKKKYY